MTYASGEGTADLISSDKIAIDDNDRSLAVFFSLGQVLPTHRAAYSPFGGLFQPSMTQAIRLLSDGPFYGAPSAKPLSVSARMPETTSIPTNDLSLHDLDAGVNSCVTITDPFISGDLSDPFTSAHLTYSTNALDTYPAPSAYHTRRFAWIHVFPEGKIHQHPDRIMRYFKWGIARLILESEPCPDVVPMWIDGLQECMHESRQWPRFLPRGRKDITVVFGRLIDSEQVFGDLRAAWQVLQRRSQKRLMEQGQAELGMGILSEDLMYGDEAVRLREECTLRLREEVLKVRKVSGLPEEDPKCSRVETWREEWPTRGREGKMGDESWQRDT